MGSGEESGLRNSCPECGEVVDVSRFGPYSKIACPACGGAMRVRLRFNHFAIERKLGEGGMSQVFQARDETLNRSVALKILHSAFTADAELTRRFETEARLTASISHPNVVKVYSVGEDQGYFYIAMEVVDGRNLEELISAEGRLAESRVWDIGIQVVQGLRAAHQGGLIHRDIKPGNILLARGEVAKIVDFGLALVAGRDADDSKVIWATPYYVSPEKLYDEPEDFRSDIYSLGATLFHALAGRPPFEASTHSVDELRAIKNRPVSLADAAPDVTAGTCRVIDRMLARNPADRFESYDALLQAMTAARALGGRPASRRPYSQRALALAAALFFVAAFAILHFGRKGRDSGGEAAGPGPSEAPAAEGAATAREGSATGGAAKFIEARDLLLSGDFANARSGFEALIDEGALSWPTSEWAIFNAGLCALLDGEAGAARGLFERLGHAVPGAEAADDDGLAAFFREVADHMRRELPVMTAELEAAATSPAHAMAWLAYGLKNWQDGRFEEAGAFFDALRDAAPPQRLEWINSYKALLEPFPRDKALISLIPRPQCTMNLAEIEDMLITFGEIEGHLKVKGSGMRLLEEQHARARKLQEQRVEELKAKERERIAAAKAAEERTRAEEMSRCEEVLGAAQRLAQEQGFGKALELLAETKFGTAPAREALDDALRVYRNAEAFLPALVEDLNRHSYTGEIGRAGAPALRGTITRASASDLRIRLDLGEAVGETTMPLASLSREGLLRIAHQVAAAVSPESERRKRREMAVFYARLTGQHDYAKAAGDALALEDEEFAVFWKRLPAPEKPQEGGENQS